MIQMTCGLKATVGTQQWEAKYRYLSHKFILRFHVSCSELKGAAVDSPEPHPSGVLQTVDRALSVLLSFDGQRTEWGVFELAQEFGFNRSTAQRILSTLAARGFLHSDPTTRKYALGPAMWRVAARWERTGGLARVAEPILADLAHATCRTASLTVPDGFHVRCVAAVDGDSGPVRHHPLVGDLYPAHAGATSRAYFAFLEPHERNELLHGRPFARYTDLTTDDEVELDWLMDETLEHGWAESEGEYDSSTRAIAAPVMAGRRPIASMTVVERKVNDADDPISDYVPQLRQACHNLSVLLSRPYAPPRPSARLTQRK